MSNAMEISHPLLSMEQVEEPGVLLSRVGLQVKKEMNLMRSRRFPFPEEVEHVQGNHALNFVRGDLKRIYAEVICHPYKIWVQRQASASLFVVPRPCTPPVPWIFCPLVLLCAYHISVGEPVSFGQLGQSLCGNNGLIGVVAIRRQCRRFDDRLLLNLHNKLPRT